MKNNIYIPNGSNYPNDAVHYNSESHTIYPLGGGFHKPVDSSFFHNWRQVTEDEISSLQLQPQSFCLDDIGPFPGFTKGLKWNGWECPSFTLEVAMAIANTLNFNPTYDPKTRRITLPLSDEYQNEEPDVYEGYDVEIGNKRYHLYPMGSHSWTWEKA